LDFSFIAINSAYVPPAHMCYYLYKRHL